MNLLNRYAFRASGESRFQAKDNAERIVFGIIDFFKEQKVFHQIDDEEALNTAMENLASFIRRRPTDANPAMTDVTMEALLQLVPIVNNEEWNSKDEDARADFLTDLSCAIQRSSSLENA